MKIEVGMLVEVIANLVIAGRHTGETFDVMGHVGQVTGFENHSYGEIGWIVSGLEVVCVFRSQSLKPINPDSEPADEDFQEDLKRWLGKKVTA